MSLGIKVSRSVVHIKTPDGLNSGRGTKITNDEGAEMLGVARAVITVDPTRVVTANLDVHCDWEGDAEATFIAKHPLSG